MNRLGYFKTHCYRFAGQWTCSFNGVTGSGWTVRQAYASLQIRFQELTNYKEKLRAP